MHPESRPGSSVEDQDLSWRRTVSPAHTFANSGNFHILRATVIGQLKTAEFSAFRAGTQGPKRPRVRYCTA